MSLYRVIIGIGVAGETALAGPVVVSAAAFLVGQAPIVAFAGSLEDSEPLSVQEASDIKDTIQRMALEIAVQQGALAHATLIRSAQEVDAKLVSTVVEEASLLAVARVMEQLNTRFPAKEDFLVLRAEPTHDWHVEAAGLLAKQKFDRAMNKIAERYPTYGFATNRGYATKKHRQALIDQGPCPEHRRTFKTVYESGPPCEGAEEL